MSSTICVDGGIGLGKSTFIERICEDRGVVQAVLGPGKFVVPVLEPLAAWTASGVFQLMCEDPAEWALPFQHDAMITRIARWTTVWRENCDNPNAVLLLERAPQSDKDVFTKVLTQRGHITPRQQAEHGEWWQFMWDKRPSEISRIGVLHAPFDTAQQRISARDRAGEDKYDWAYLDALHRSYENIRIECAPGVSSVHLDATVAFHSCREALLRTFAVLCGVKKPLQHFECTCGKCE